MDIAALGAAPPPDACCASAEISAGAGDAFAALLDEASATGEDTPSDPRTGKDDGEENFDELAALAMTSLLSIGVTVQPVIDAGNADEIAAAEIADTEITATDITGQAVVTDLTARAALVDVGTTSWQTTPSTTIGNDMGVDTSDAPVMIDTPAAATAPDTTAESAWSDAATTAAPIAGIEAADIEGSQDVTAASAGKAEAEVKPAARPSRSSKPSRSQPGQNTHKADALNADAVTASSPASVAQTIDAARTSAPTQQTADVRPSGSAAARFARALERAAAPAASEAASSAASTANANSGGSGQPSGGSTPDPAAQFSAASRQSAPNTMAFMVNGPMPLDTRAMAAAVAAATGHVDSAPVAIPERDVIAQLVQSMRVQFRDGIGEAVLKLNPEHLGSVQISLRIENGAIKATVQAEAPAVRQWLESQQETLRTSLADQGLRLERFVVEPDGERQTAPDDDAREQKEQRRRQQHRRQMSEKDHPIFEITV